MKDKVLKIASWIVLCLTTLLSLLVLSSIFFISIWIKNINLTKLFIVSAGIVVFAGIIFIMGLACFEFVRSLIHMKEEMTEIEEKLNQNQNDKQPVN